MVENSGELDTRVRLTNFSFEYCGQMIDRASKSTFCQMLVKFYLAGMKEHYSHVNRKKVTA